MGFKRPLVQLQSLGPNEEGSKVQTFGSFFAFTGMFYTEKLLNLHHAFMLKNGLVCNVSVIAQHVFFTKHRLFCANRRNLRPDNTLTYHHWCARSIQACLYPRLLHAS